MKKTAPFLSLAVALTAQDALAQHLACSTEALITANQNMYDQFEVYAANQMDQGKSAQQITADMEAITDAGNAQKTLGRYEVELDTMTRNPDHQPSQALCDDMYTMIETMQAELDARR